MKRALLSASAALLLFGGLVGCGDDDDPAVQTTPVVSPEPTPAGTTSADRTDDSDDSATEALTGKDLECKNEIVRQMNDPAQETDDTPPECEGIADERIFELATIAEGEAEPDS